MQKLYDYLKSRRIASNMTIKQKSLNLIRTAKHSVSFYMSNSNFSLPRTRKSTASSSGDTMNFSVSIRPDQVEQVIYSA